MPTPRPPPRRSEAQRDEHGDLRTFSVYISGLPSDTQPEDVHMALAREVGGALVARCVVVRDGAGRCRGHGHVELLSESARETALHATVTVLVSAHACSSACGRLIAHR